MFFIDYTPKVERTSRRSLVNLIMPSAILPPVNEANLSKCKNVLEASLSSSQ